MKCYIIRETTGYPTIIRDGRVVSLELGSRFSEDELASLTCDTYVTYLCTEDNTITTQEPGIKVSTPVVQETTVVQETSVAPVKEAEAPETD